MAKDVVVMDDDPVRKGRGFPFRLWLYALAMTAAAGGLGYFAWKLRGDTERAFEWLERAAQNRDPSFGAIPFNQLCESLHKDARWLRFLRKYGMASEQLAAVKFQVRVPS